MNYEALLKRRQIIRKISDIPMRLREMRKIESLIAQEHVRIDAHYPNRILSPTDLAPDSAPGWNEMVWKRTQRVST